MVPKKVLFVLHSCKLYGAERSIFTLISGLRQSGQITPVVLLPGKGPLSDLIRDAGIQVITRPYFNWLGPTIINRITKGPVRLMINLISLASLYNTINNLRPDLIYSNTLVVSLGMMISLTYRLPHIWHAREFVHEDMRMDYDFGTSLSMSLIGKASKVICNSYAVKEKLSRLIKKDIFEVIYNGFKFDLKISQKASAKFEHCVIRTKPIKLLIVGQIYPGKGHKDAIMALAVLASKGYPVELSIVGSGKARYLDFLRELSNQLSVNDKVAWHGFVDNPLTYMADAAIVLVCSRCEAFGRVAVEAMGTGTPVVGSRRGGLPEIIEDSVTGLLYQPGDYKALARQIERLLTERGLYEDIAERGRQSVATRFSVDQYVTDAKNIIEQVCEQC